MIIRRAETIRKIKGEKEKHMPPVSKEQLLTASLNKDISLTPNTNATDNIDTIDPTNVPNNDTCKLIFTAFSNKETFLN